MKLIQVIRSLSVPLMLSHLTLCVHAHTQSNIQKRYLQNEGRDPSTLILAYNAAYAQLLREGRYADFVSSNNVEHVAPSYCNPYGVYAWPSRNSLTERDTLFDVLNTNVLKIAAVGKADWGPDGDYTADPPVGFWPDLLNEIVKNINTFYNSNVVIERTHTEGNITSMLQSDDAHMTDVYMLLSALDDNGFSRVHGSDVGCPLAYSAQFAVLLKSRNLNTFPSILSYLRQPANSASVIGVLSPENRDIIKSNLPSNIQNYRVFASDDLLMQAVNDGSVFMGVATGHFDNLGDTVIEIDTDAPVTFGPFFKKTTTSQSCNSAAMIKALVPEIVLFAGALLLTSF